MDTRRFIIRKTLVILLGQVLCGAIMCGIFALLGRFDWRVLLGAAVGAVCATAEFFFMALSADYAADRAKNQDVKGGKTVIKTSYFVRIVILFLVLFAFAKSKLCNPIALIIPIGLTRPILMVTEFFRKSGDKTA